MYDEERDSTCVYMQIANTKTNSTPLKVIVNMKMAKLLQRRLEFKLDSVLLNEIIDDKEGEDMNIRSSFSHLGMTMQSDTEILKEAARMISLII